MVRPCVARGFRRSVGSSVLHQCIRPLIGACAPGHQDISARAFSLAARPQVGHLGHQFSHAPGRPVLHLFSSSRRPRRETGYVISSSLAPYRFSSFVRARRPFLRPGLQLISGAARRGRQGWPSRLAHLCLGISRPRLDGPEQGASLKQVGMQSHRSSHTRRRALC